MSTLRFARARSRRATRLARLAAEVLERMRNGEDLILEYGPSGPRWRLSRSRHVLAEVAKLLIDTQRVTAVGDALFEKSASQTWRYIDPSPNQTGE